MHKKASCMRKMFFSRRLEPIKKLESQENKAFGKSCRQLMKNALITGFAGHRRRIKLCVFLICTAGFFYHTWSFLEIYLSYPTSLDISEEYPETIDAPAITICDRNRLMRQRYCKKYLVECDGQHTTWEMFCDAYPKHCLPYDRPLDFNFGFPNLHAFTRLNRSNAVLNAIGPRRSDYLMGCDLNRVTSTGPCKDTQKKSVTVWSLSNNCCSAQFKIRTGAQPIQVAKNGFPYTCFSIFSLLGQQNEEPLNLTFIDEQRIAFLMNPEEYINANDLVQISVSLHDPRKVVNPMTEGKILSAGKGYKLYVNMEKRVSLPPPYSSNCVDYLKIWKKNGGYGPLSKKDCTDLCKIKAMTDEYDCVGQAITYPNNYTICNNRAVFASPEVTRRCESGCRDACQENIYSFTPEIEEDYSNTCDHTNEYCKNKRIGLIVSFTRMTVQKFQQIPRFESIELFSYIGGYLGMWLGISLASLFDLSEMMYDVIAYPFLKSRRIHRKKKRPIEQFPHRTA